MSDDIAHEQDVITLKPGETCRYELHIEVSDGDRNQALQKVFREWGGYRVDPAAYDFRAYNAPETAWVKNVTAAWLNWAWDKANFDPLTGNWRLEESLSVAQARIGGFDAFILWPFWPRAGFDDRSQFDHYADLPGGLRSPPARGHPAHRRRHRSSAGPLDDQLLLRRSRPAGAR